MKHPAGTILAALLLVASMVLYVMSGDATASAGGSTGDSETSTSVLQALPACRVDVASNGIGSQRHHHVTVVLDNDVRTLWLLVESPLGTRTVEVPARDGWSQVALPAEEDPTSVVVFGSPNLEPFYAGCGWTA